jgi:hypothetical protein
MPLRQRDLSARARALMESLDANARFDLHVLASAIADHFDVDDADEAQLTWTSSSGGLRPVIAGGAHQSPWSCSGATKAIFFALARGGLAELRPEVDGWPSLTIAREPAEALLDVVIHSTP